MTHTLFHRLAVLFFPVFITMQPVPAAEIELPELPRDENEALQMLEEGTLDSSVWRKVEPYYTAPLNVPLGELRILKDLFPELSDDIPGSAEELSKYLPWNKSSIDRFFADFPELDPFKPVLSFACGPLVGIPLQAGFYFSRRSTADSGRYYTMFAVRQDRITASGRVDFTDACGRWFRRSVSVAPRAGMAVGFGNFSPKRRSSLSTGYFPRSGSRDSSIADNWLFGSSSVWNGAAVSLSRPGERRECELLLHAGPTEWIGQVIGETGFISGGSCFGGISYVRASGDDSTPQAMAFIEAGMESSPSRQWRYGIEISVNAKTPFSVPWRAFISNSGAVTGFKAALTGLPADYAAPRGETTRLLRSRAGDDSSRAYLFEADLQFRRRLGDFITYMPRIDVLMSDSRPRYIKAGIQLSGRYWCSYRFWYSWSPLAYGQSLGPCEQMMAACSFPVCRGLSLDCSENILFRNGFWSSRCRITAPLKAGEALEVSPVFMFYVNETGRRETAAGISHRLILYKKTYSDMTIEQELPFSSWRTMRARGKMSFFF